MKHVRARYFPLENGGSPKADLNLPGQPMSAFASIGEGIATMAMPFATSARRRGADFPEAAQKLRVFLQWLCR